MPIRLPSTGYPRAEHGRRWLLSLLLVALAWQAARLVWMLAVAPTPIGEPAAAAASDPVAFTTIGDPFFRTGITGPVTTSVNGLTLFGVRLSPTPASAILQLEGEPQVVVMQGEPLANGMRLQEVAAGHVILLDAAGGAHRVDMPPPSAEDPPQAPPASLPASAPPASTAPPSPAAVLDQAGLVPRQENGRTTGYSIVPRGNVTLLQQAGLRAGDIVTAINGNALTPERMAELKDELEGGDAATLTIERDGQPQTIQLRTKPL